ncbi:MULTISPECIES: hypothetical protein [Pseudomonas]|uniref:Uncharacterized protein n=1 Tax=Pseudomonas syringae pv. papulans TaxID=83963 RepID=A0AA43DY87_PSESX|nr:MULTISPECIES: hypothetical protein [Pseudomonas]MDH4603807.1 hypothetical protein [Pseudomonas syringae pv. papulans]MDH4625618.1 hypothetical protein [Pseudomonas syringae pv. papulans]
MQAINEIKKAALECKEVFLDENLLTLNEAMLDAFFDQVGGVDTYENVQLSSINTVTHRNEFSADGMTWRKAVDNLHGTNWDSRVLDYFKGSLQHVKFPPENSVNELKLGRYGIKYNVECGVHRVIAGKAWLAHQFGGNAYFSNCLVRSHVINTEVRSFLKEHGQFGLLIYKTSLHPMDKIFINNAVPRYLIASCKFPYKMYLLTEDVCEISRFNRLNPLNWLKILCGTSITEKDRYRTLTPQYIEDIQA